MSMLNENRYRVLTVNFEKQDYQQVPFIHLQGKWLGKVGFQQGNKIKVEIQPGMLIIHQLALEEPHGGKPVI